MKATIHTGGRDLIVDFSKPIDISLEITNSDENPIAWYLEKPIIEPVRIRDWIGKVSQGSSSTNFNTITFNPHGHGTHTECLGHITNEFFSVNKALSTFFFRTELITLTPEPIGEDLVITKDQVVFALSNKSPEAIVIRTTPNTKDKKTLKYSNTNPPYLDSNAAKYLFEIGVQHLLIDLPSVDKEKDGGALLAHKAFWNVTNVVNLNSDARKDATITELIYVPTNVLDGTYLLNLQIASFKNDATPSKPVLYAVES